MKPILPHRRPSPDELRKLPPEQRDSILAAQAALAELLYRTDPDVTAFEAFGEEDFDGEAPSAEAR